MGPHRDYVHVTEMKVSAINCFFNIQLHRYVDTSAKKEILRTEDIPTLPNGVKAIHRLFGDFFPQSKQLIDTQGLEYPGINVTPELLQEQYNLQDVSGDFGQSSGQAFAAFGQAEFNQTLVDWFLRKYNLTDTTINIIGNNTGGYFGKASLEAEYITAVGNNITTYFIHQDELDMLAWCQLVQRQENPPKVLSVSAGSGESGFDR